MTTTGTRRPWRVNLVARDNGFGLSRDIVLLQRALVANGCDVHVTPLGEADERRRWKLGKRWRANVSHLRHAWHRKFGQPPFDLNIMFEHLWPDQLPLARHNIALPNPEWFDRRDLFHLRRIDRVWAKTRHAQEIFAALGCATSLVGFDSDDALREDAARQRSFFHLAGGSPIKGTERLIALWQRHPEWPQLEILQHPSRAQPLQPPAANIRLRAEYLPDTAQLRQLQNTHRFHLCTSATEGWGHYIVEAMSMGSVTVTLDAPPMNELVRPERGVLVACRENGGMGLATTYGFDEAAMEQAVAHLVAMPDAECERLGHHARQWFLDNHLGFDHRVEQALRDTL